MLPYCFHVWWWELNKVAPRSCVQGGMSTRKSPLFYFFLNFCTEGIHVQFDAAFSTSLFCYVTQVSLRIDRTIPRKHSRLDCTDGCIQVIFVWCFSNVQKHNSSSPHNGYLRRSTQHFSKNQQEKTPGSNQGRFILSSITWWPTRCSRKPHEEGTNAETLSHCCRS